MGVHSQRGKEGAGTPPCALAAPPQRSGVRIITVSKISSLSKLSAGLLLFAIQT